MKRVKQISASLLLAAFFYLFPPVAYALDSAFVGMPMWVSIVLAIGFAVIVVGAVLFFTRSGWH